MIVLPQMNYTYVIIGGGIAGTTAAQVLREKDPQGSIAIISEEPHRLYSRIMLSKRNFFLGIIPFDSVWLKKQEWYEEKKIDFIPNRNVTRISSNEHVITLDNGETHSYTKLLIATGGVARPLTVPGSDLQGVVYVRTLDDAKNIMEKVKVTKKVVIIGSGFIGFEMSDLMRSVNAEVTVLIRGPRYWHSLLDESSSTIIENAFTTSGVSMRYNVEVKEVRGNDHVEHVVLSDGTTIECDLVMVGIGIVYDIPWIQESGIEVNKGVIANEYLETSASDIWVAGDIAEFNDTIAGRKVQLGNWANAQMQGRVAALNMTGERTPFRLVSFYTTHGFDSFIAFAGDVLIQEGSKELLRSTANPSSVIRFLCRNSKVVGATLINRTQDLSSVIKMIDTQISIEGKESQLEDSSIPLTSFIT